MGGEEFSPDREHLDQVERVRSEADSLIQLQYGMNPDLTAFSYSRADLFSQAVAQLLEVDSQVDAAIPKLHGAFTKLIFTFTNPEDYDDTVDAQTILNVINDFLGSVTYAGKVATSQLIADYIDVLSSSMFLVEQNLSIEGVLDDMTAEDAFAVVQAWLELATQPETGEPGGP